MHMKNKGSSLKVEKYMAINDRGSLVEWSWALLTIYTFGKILPFYM